MLEHVINRTEMPNFHSVRIVNVDFYMAPPMQHLDVAYSEFRSSSIIQVPVIRIFGSTDKGKKICLHIHGVFPYFYIPYDGLEDVIVQKFRIAVNIDKALNVSLGQASSSVQHVYKITLVSGFPLYGYHAKEHQFFKVCLFNPNLIRKVSNLLQSEAILGKLYQPYESHIPYILQFMIDYNLHGMSKIILKELTFRANNDLLQEFIKQSWCELEADALSEHIINRLEVIKGNVAINPGIDALWQDEKQRLRDKKEDSQIDQCLTLSNSQFVPTKSHELFKKTLSKKLILTENIVDKAEQINVVYPIETDCKDQNNSVSDFHSLHSLESNNSLVNQSTTLDDEARNLFKILHNLGDNKEREDIDSILSQIPIEDEDEDEDNLDLSVSLADTTTFINGFNEEGNFSSDSSETTMVPQVDGQHDSDSSDENDHENNFKQKKKPNRYRALPINTPSSTKNTNQGNTEGFLVKNKKKYSEKVKRKLNFHNNLKSSVTIFEENLDCNLKTNFRENTYSLKGSVIAKGDINLKNGSSENAKHSHPSELTVAKLYDFQTNFKPKEGSSKKLTQNSEESHLTGLSNCSNSQKQSETSQSLYYCRDNDNSQNSNEYVNKNILTSFSNDLLITSRVKPITRDDVISSLSELNISQVHYQVPYYSEINDVTGSVQIGHSVLKILHISTPHLEDFKSLFNGLDSYRKLMFSQNIKWSYENVRDLKLSFCSAGNCVVTPVKQPPTVHEVIAWSKKENNSYSCQKKIKTEKKKMKIFIPISPGTLDENELDLTFTVSQTSILEDNLKDKKKNSNNSCQISGVTLNNTYGFKITPENYQNVKALNEFQYITICSLELHVETRGELKPDPTYDSIKAIFYSISEDKPESINISGIIAFKENKTINCNEDCQLICTESEEELFTELINLIKKWDPDILIGYEAEMLSWGYLMDRARILGHNLELDLSRIKDKKSQRNYEEKNLRITGRIILDIWRLMRHEIALQSYTFENIVYHVLHQRVPSYSFKKLSCWWDDRSSLFRHRTISYYLFRVKTLLKIIEQLDLIGRTSELARLFGIQFFEVLSRGSQFRVESMMLRLAKPLNYISVSPSVEQRAKMKAPEFLPLILEPKSKLYTDPVIVLDFQSLYPSIIIAYNYCFSTCIGKVINLGKDTPFEFGATHLKISKKTVQKLLNDDCLNFSPCGVAFVKANVRDGILPRMLREILETRLMVKNSMKKNKGDKVLQKILYNRQLGLKLIANVTYGYTAANFSGRMPAVELGDSVVSKGRETLQRAITLVENTKEWRAKVVYGDTDSLFVLVPGRSKKEAFQIGEKIAQAVTKDNPNPVKLKLEKIYLPSILQTKKRYVGYMYESPDQDEPVYDAKGIETVRRDGCPAVAKILEKCLRLLFETKNVTLVKKYVQRQFQKVLSGRVSLQDLTFAKEYRGASGYRPGACVPSLELARKWTATDKRSEPRRGERVPYIICNGPPGVPLIRLVRSPRDFFNDPSLRPNAIYYITKVIIPPISRCFNLIGADVMAWFNQLPRKQLQGLPNSSPGKKSTISQYFLSSSCIICGEQTQNNLCINCNSNPQKTFVILNEKLRHWEQVHSDVNSICQSCSGILNETFCTSLDCPVLYKVNQTNRNLQQAIFVRQILKSLE